MATGALMVLLAEDDSSLRKLIASHLTREGMQVVEVADGTELHDYLAAARPSGEPRDPDIVVSDVDMPGSTGPDAIERSNNRRAPVVLITASATSEVRDAADRVGAAELLEKPFPMRALARTIRRVAGRPRASAPTPVADYALSTG